MTGELVLSAFAATLSMVKQRHACEQLIRKNCTSKLTILRKNKM